MYTSRFWPGGGKRVNFSVIEKPLSIILLCPDFLYTFFFLLIQLTAVVQLFADEEKLHHHHPVKEEKKNTMKNDKYKK